jgi:hypothetical protein
MSLTNAGLKVRCSRWDNLKQSVTEIALALTMCPTHKALQSSSQIALWLRAFSQFAASKTRQTRRRAKTDTSHQDGLSTKLRKLTLDRLKVVRDVGSTDYVSFSRQP